MSIVCWDGKTLAADRMADTGGTRSIMPKSRLSSNGKFVLAWIGGIAEGLALAKWYESIVPIGSEKERSSYCSPPLEFPACQNTDRWSRLIVATKERVVYYEREPILIPVHENFFAWGSGRDIALGAMAMGANARRAVEIAISYDVGCGVGVDCYDLTAL